MSEVTGRARGFEPPPYPYDRLDDLREVADDAAGRRGRPVHRHALRPAARRGRGGAGLVGRRAGLPAVGRHARPSGPRPPAGSSRRFGVDGRPGAPGRLRGHQGVRGRRAPLAAPARPRPRHRALPAGQLPVLRDGRHAGRLPGGAVRHARRRRRPTTPRGPCACGSTRRATRPASSTTWPRPRPGAAGTGCRCCPTSATSSSPGTGPGARSWRTGLDGVLAVHSLSKRSNLAGARVGFYAGDPDLVHYLSEVRKHAGFMVPGPVQAAAVAAFDDDAPRRRSSASATGAAWRCMATCWPRSGVECPLPAGAFYLWVPAPGGDAWGLARGLAAEAGPSCRPASSTARRAPATSASPSSSPTTASTWWPSGSASRRGTSPMSRPVRLRETGRMQPGPYPDATSAPPTPFDPSRSARRGCGSSWRPVLGVRRHHRRASW